MVKSTFQEKLEELSESEISQICKDNNIKCKDQKESNIIAIMCNYRANPAKWKDYGWDQKTQGKIAKKYKKAPKQKRKGRRGKAINGKIKPKQAIANLKKKIKQQESIAKQIQDNIANNNESGYCPHPDNPKLSVRIGSKQYKRLQKEGKL